VQPSYSVPCVNTLRRRLTHSAIISSHLRPMSASLHSHSTRHLHSARGATDTHPNYAPAWVDSFSCQAGIGLEWPGYSDPVQMKGIFDLMANMSNLRAIGALNLTSHTHAGGRAGGSYNDMLEGCAFFDRVFLSFFFVIYVPHLHLI
jgi:hypothetical protein